MNLTPAVTSFYDSVKDAQLLCGKDEVTSLPEDLVKALVNDGYKKVQLIKRIDKEMFITLRTNYQTKIANIESSIEDVSNPYIWGYFAHIEELVEELGLTTTKVARPYTSSSTNVPSLSFDETISPSIIPF